MIVDSEGPGFRAWSELYASYGCELPFDKYSACIGTIGGFDLHGYLQQQSGRSFERDDLENACNCPMAGAHEGAAAPARHCRVRHVGEDPWSEISRRVELDRRVGDRQLAEFRVARPIRCDMHPGLCRVGQAGSGVVLLALEKLGVAADEAIAFEDSPPGILAAKRAGLFCIAIPNPLTKNMALELADRRLSSLEEFDLDHV